MSHPFFIHWEIVSIQKRNNRTELGNLRQFFLKRRVPSFFHPSSSGNDRQQCTKPNKNELGNFCFFSKALMSFFIQSTSVSTQIKQELGGTFFFPLKGSHHFSSNGRQLDEKSPITPHWWVRACELSFLPTYLPRTSKLTPRPLKLQPYLPYDLTSKNRGQNEPAPTQRWMISIHATVFFLLGYSSLRNHG